MLTELRAIRTEISHLTEKIGQAATREDLTQYATKEMFDHHLQSHQRNVEGWRAWLPWAVGVGLALYGPHILKLLGGG